MTSNTLRQQHYFPTEVNRLLDDIRGHISIAVLYAGNPDEPSTVVTRTQSPRSWKSYREVAEQIAASLRRSGFQHVHTLEEGPEFQRALEEKKFQLFWLNSAGIQGRSSIAHASSRLESAGYPYVGHSPLQAALLDDKVLMKQWLRGVGLPTSSFIVRGGGAKQTVQLGDPDFAREFGSAYTGPFLVKPALGRASLLIDIIDHIDLLDEAISGIIDVTGDRVIVERFLLGQEYCIWASRGGEVKDGILQLQRSFSAFGAAERLYLHSERIYKKEPFELVGSELCRAISEKEAQLREDLSYLAQTVFSGLSLCIPIRVDVRMDREGLLQILEVNPKPDLTDPLPYTQGIMSVVLDDLGVRYDDFIVKVLADWLDFQMRFSPATLSMLFSILDRLSSQASQQAKVVRFPSS